MSLKEKIPNALTAFRIIVIPVIGMLVFVPYAEAAYAAFALFVLAGISDFLDGYLARLWNVGSPLGRVFDPIADKLLVAALLLCLVANGIIVTIDLIPTAAILLRELLISGVREYLSPMGIVLPVSKFAKWKTASQMVALGMLLLIVVLPQLETAGLIMLWVAAGLSVWTAYEYMRVTWSSLTKA